jgi:hypothetical protein
LVPARRALFDSLDGNPMEFSLAVPTPVRTAIFAPLTRQPEPPALVSGQPDCINITDLESRLPLSFEQFGMIRE